MNAALWLLHDALLLAGGVVLGALLERRRAPRPPAPRRCKRCGRFGAGRTHVCAPRRTRRSDH